MKYGSLYFHVHKPLMKLTSMDLIGKFHPRSTAGNYYALAIILMLTGYTFCIPIKSKSASEILQGYIDFYTKCGGSTYILSDNVMKFLNP